MASAIARSASARAKSTAALSATALSVAALAGTAFSAAALSAAALSAAALSAAALSAAALSAAALSAAALSAATLSIAALSAAAFSAAALSAFVCCSLVCHGFVWRRFICCRHGCCSLRSNTSHLGRIWRSCLRSTRCTNGGDCGVRRIDPPLYQEPDAGPLRMQRFIDAVDFALRESSPFRMRGLHLGIVDGLRPCAAAHEQADRRNRLQPLQPRPRYHSFHRHQR